MMLLINLYQFDISVINYTFEEKNYTLNGTGYQNYTNYTNYTKMMTYYMKNKKNIDEQKTCKKV